MQSAYNRLHYADIVRTYVSIHEINSMKYYPFSAASNTFVPSPSAFCYV